MTTPDQRDAGSTLDREFSSERIEADHQTLVGQLDAIAAATTASALLRSLLPLPEMLEAHFAFEEQLDGFYDDLEARCPSMSNDLRALRDEHRLILDHGSSLCRTLKERVDAAAGSDRVDADIERDVAGLLDRLRAHEHRESVMIADAYYTDEGGRG